MTECPFLVSERPKPPPSPPRRQAETLGDDIRHLVEANVAADNAIILAVCKADDDQANSVRLAAPGPELRHIPP